jgi:hypothetical protein
MPLRLSIFLFISIAFNACSDSDNKKYLLKYNFVSNQEFNLSNDTEIRMNHGGLGGNSRLFSTSFNRYKFLHRLTEDSGNMIMRATVLDQKLHINENNQITNYDSKKDEVEMEQTELLFHSDAKKYLNKKLMFMINSQGKLLGKVEHRNGSFFENNFMDIAILFPNFPKKPIQIGDKWTIKNKGLQGVERSFIYRLHSVDSNHYYINILKMSTERFSDSKQLKTNGLIILNKKDCSVSEIEYIIQGLSKFETNHFYIKNKIKCFYFDNS